MTILHTIASTVRWWLQLVIERFRPQTRINREIERVELPFLGLPQTECPLTHKFAPGVYLREIFMPAGTFVIGQEHRTRHFNVVLSGRARVMLDGVTQEVVGPCTFVSEPGVRKVLFIIEDMRWATIHATRETDVERLEKLLVKPSKGWIQAHEMKQLTGGAQCHS